MAMATHGRSAEAPGHTRSTEPVIHSAVDRTPGDRREGDPSPVPATGTAGRRTVERPAVVLASVAAPESHETPKARKTPKAPNTPKGPKGPVATAPRPAGAASVAASAPGRLAHAPSTPLVVPTPAVTALGGPPAGDPPGLAKGRADR
jgi:hypothetical protein